MGLYDKLTLGEAILNAERVEKVNLDNNGKIEKLIELAIADRKKSYKFLKRLRKKFDTFYKLREYLQSKYRREEGEIFLSPEIYDLIGGDCDDQARILLAMAPFYFKKTYVKDIGLAVIGRENPTHIAMVLNGIFNDCLPYPINGKIKVFYDRVLSKEEVDKLWSIPMF